MALDKDCTQSPQVRPVAVELDEPSPSAWRPCGRQSTLHAVARLVHRAYHIAAAMSGTRRDVCELIWDPRPPWRANQMKEYLRSWKGMGDALESLQASEDLT